MIFGAEWCQYCQMEKAALAQNSRFYNMVYLDIDEPKNRALMEAWKMGPAIPVTVIVENGKPVKYWSGYVGWNSLYPHVSKAKKTNEQRKPDFILKPF